MGISVEIGLGRGYPGAVAAVTAQAGAEMVLPVISDGTTWAENRPVKGTAHGLVQLFPSDNWWNLDISGAPVDSHSTTWLNTLGTQTLWPEFGMDYGIPWCTVSGNYPKVSFAGADYWSECDQIPYPIPIPALTQVGWTEDLTHTIEDPPGGMDKHIMIVDKDNNVLYEIYRPYHNGTGSPVQWEPGVYVQPGQYYCTSCVHWDMNTNNTRPDGWTSADAAGLQILPGLLQFDEVAYGSTITHAHRFTLSGTTGYVWPATHEASNGWTPFPLGARLRLKASYDITGGGNYPAFVQRVLQAFKTYGLIVADNGGGPNGYVTGMNDQRFGDTSNPGEGGIYWMGDSPGYYGLVYMLFQVIMRDHMELVQLGWGEP